MGAILAFNPYPVSSGWEDVPLPQSLVPDQRDPNPYALTTHGNSMEPFYRGGDMIIISPATSIRSGDRVVARTVQGEVMAKILSRHMGTRRQASIRNATIWPVTPPDFPF
jgi:phage repressor protein C with HTH and peptisase S24 domain